MRDFGRRHAIALISLSALAGCAGLDDPQTAGVSSIFEGSAPSARGNLGALTYRAVDQMLASAPSLSPRTPLAVATISDVRDLETSSPFGNIVADLIRGRLVQKGMLVSDMRLRSSVFLRKDEGEIMLSRDPRAMQPPISAAAVVTGTYAESSNAIYVSLKLISTSDGRIISSADFVSPVFGNERLLGQHAAAT